MVRRLGDTFNPRKFCIEKDRVDFEKKYKPSLDFEICPKEERTKQSRNYASMLLMNKITYL
jgi:hypothetical protein